MGRQKGSKNKVHSGITYPRKCNDCDYVSNNPQMWHYHKQIHEAIPEGQKCDHGCGQDAMFKNTNGKYTCTKISHHCSKYLELHSDRVKAQWATPESVDRKEKTREIFIECCVRNENVITKSKNTKRRKKYDSGVTEEIQEDFRRYSRMIRRRGTRERKEWALSMGYKIGKFTYHIDHKLSVFDCWKAGLPEEIVNHPANLQIVEYRENLKKGNKSSITLDELLYLIETFVSPK